MYKTDYKRNVLISYITYPFIYKSEDRFYMHTNFIESIEISKIWKNLGFNVDIFNYDYRGKINYSKYDVIFGFGDPLCKYFYNQNPNKRVITIYYGTGMHVCHQNNFTLQRVKDAGLLFDPNNVEDMAEKIYKIWIDENLRKELIQKGFERIKDLTLEKYANEWKNIIDEVLEKINGD